MTKKSSRKSGKKNARTGIFSTLFDIFTALLILAAAGIIVWYFIFYEPGEKKKDSVKEKIENLSKQNKTVKDQPFDPKADEIEQDRIDEEYFEGGEEMTEQFEEELVSNFTSEDDNSSKGSGSYEKSVSKWASKYKGLPYRNGADPDKDGASDNSHLLCSVWENAAKENKMNFTGYMNTETIIGNLIKVEAKDLRNGDLILLTDGMIGMITDHVSSEQFSVIYASSSQRSIIKTESSSLKYYWLKPGLFKSFNRLNNKVLN